MQAIHLVIDLLIKNRFFSNLASYQFYKNKINFLEYVVSAQKIKIEEKRVKVIKNWFEQKLM